MNKIKKISNLIFMLLIVLSFNPYSVKALDFTSNQIIVISDTVATQKKLYPVLIVENTTDKELNVTYTFYVNNEDASSFTDKSFVIKPHSKLALEIPELHHLGDTQEQRTIWFNWNNSNIRKPLQTEATTSTFKNPNESDDKQPNIEFGNSLQ